MIDFLYSIYDLWRQFFEYVVLTSVAQKKPTQKPPATASNILHRDTYALLPAHLKLKTNTKAQFVAFEYETCSSSKNGRSNLMSESEYL